MSTAKRKRLPLGKRLLLAALLLAAALPLGLWQVRHSDLSYAKQETQFRYPDAEILQTTRGAGILPHEMTTFCRDTEYGFVFIQTFTRDGAQWYAAEEPPGGYQYMRAGREKADRCIAAAQTNLPHFTIYDPYSLSGFFVVTRSDAPADVEALYDAFLPAAQAEGVSFSVLACPTLYDTLRETDFSVARYAHLTEIDFAHLDESETAEYLALCDLRGVSAYQTGGCPVTPGAEETYTIPEAFALLPEQAAADLAPHETYPHTVWQVLYCAANGESCCQLYTSE